MRHALKSKPELIKIFAHLFSQCSYDGVSLTLISKSTDLDKGSLYHFFPGGKKEMVTEALKFKINQLVLTVLTTLSGEGPPEDHLVKFFQAIADFYDQGKSYCLIGVLSSSSVNALIAKELENACETWVAELTPHIQKHGVSHAETQALACLASVQGALLLERFTPQRTPLLSVLNAYAQNWRLAWSYS